MKRVILPFAKLSSRTHTIRRSLSVMPFIFRLFNVIPAEDLFQKKDVKYEKQVWLNSSQFEHSQSSINVYFCGLLFNGSNRLLSKVNCIIIFTNHIHPCAPSSLLKLSNLSTCISRIQVPLVGQTENRLGHSNEVAQKLSNI